jgi:hypothetical protein
MAGTLLVFFVWTYPANRMTENGTVVSVDWQLLRRQWEFSHAVNALLTFAALGLAAWSMIAARD